MVHALLVVSAKSAQRGVDPARGGKAVIGEGASYEDVLKSKLKFMFMGLRLDNLSQQTRGLLEIEDTRWFHKIFPRLRIDRGVTCMSGNVLKCLAEAPRGEPDELDGRATTKRDVEFVVIIDSQRVKGSLQGARKAVVASGRPPCSVKLSRCCI